MNIDLPYRYAIIRYMHDRRTEEFVNVGVILECAATAFIACRVDTSFARMSHFFPGANTVSTRAFLKSLEARMRDRARRISSNPSDIFKPTRSYLEEVWSEVFPRDDSALGFSEIKAGIANDPQKALDRIFDKTVGAYKAKADKGSRSDEDVWAAIEPAFAQRALSKRLVEHEVRAALSEYKFEHALKNGRWHCVEPVSIDLMSSENIRGKVQKLFGAMALIKGAAHDVNVYFVLSEPRTDAARRMFAEAKQVIESVDISHVLFLEHDAPRLADDLARQVAH